MTPEPIHKLMQAYFSGKATPEQLSELEDWLREDAAHVREFVAEAKRDLPASFVASGRKSEPTGA